MFDNPCDASSEEILWSEQAISNGEWKGVLLREVLNHALFGSLQHLKRRTRYCLFCLMDDFKYVHLIKVLGIACVRPEARFVEFIGLDECQKEGLVLFPSQNLNYLQKAIQLRSVYRDRKGAE